MKQCKLSEQPEFAQLSERARSMYRRCAGIADVSGVVQKPKEARRWAGATDEDVRELLRRGYLVPVEGGRAFVVRCPYMRMWAEEYIEQQGHAPTLDELERATCGQ